MELQSLADQQRVNRAESKNIGPDDPRYSELTRRGFNKRFEAKPGLRSARRLNGRCHRCRAKPPCRPGLRLAVRSGGHCREGFVADPAVRVIIDMSPRSSVAWTIRRWTHTSSRLVLRRLVRLTEGCFLDGASRYSLAKVPTSASAATHSAARSDFCIANTDSRSTIYTPWRSWWSIRTVLHGVSSLPASRRIRTASSGGRTLAAAAVKTSVSSLDIGFVRFPELRNCVVTLKAEWAWKDMDAESLQTTYMQLRGVV